MEGDEGWRRGWKLLHKDVEDCGWLQRVDCRMLHAVSLCIVLSHDRH